MKLNEKVPIYAHSRYKTYYENLGYTPIDDYFWVNVDDLPDHSSVMETRICDIHGGEFTRSHEHHVTTFKRFGMDICGECVKNNKDIRKIIQEKKEKAWDEKYGGHPMHIEEIKNKVQKTYEERYGGHPMHNEEIKVKWLETLNEKFGGNSPFCDEQVYAKAMKTLSERDRVPTSSQQVKIFEIISEYYGECFLNYPVGNFALDIFLEYEGMKIDIEYDGEYWHRDEQKDRKRDEVLKRKGYKIFRIKAKHKISSLEQIQEGIDFLKNHNYSQLKLE